MRKKLLIIILVLLAISIGLYLYKKRVTNTPSDNTLFPTGNPTIPNTGSLGENQPDGTQNNTNIGGDTVAADSYLPFTQLTTRPVAGFTSFNANVVENIPADPNNPKSKPTTKTVSKHFIRYISRNNGYVYEIADGAIPLQITNIYIPNIYEAFFADNNQTAILRFLRNDQKTIATFTVPVPPENKDGTRTQKEGSYLPDNIKSIAISPDGTMLARLLSTPTLNTVTLTNTANNKKVEIYSSLLKEWLVYWPTQKSVYLQTKASFDTPGYLYQIDQASKRLRRVIGAVKGLTVSISPSGNYIVYSESKEGSFDTKILNIKTNTTKSLGLSLLPEKCAWLKNEDLICAGNSSVTSANYPDDWYMGTLKFSDQLYHIYTNNSIYDVIYKNNIKSFDMTNLLIDEDNSLLYFIDKQTGLLWDMKY